MSAATDNAAVSPDANGGEPSMLDGALALARAGVPVFPVAPRSKKPLTRRGHLDATTDPERVRRYWRTVPNARIGRRTGFGLVVIDVDPKNGGRADERWFATYTVRTPSGGTHHYFHAAGEVRSGTLGAGLDIKGDGGYVLAPPTPGYIPLNEEAPILALPPLARGQRSGSFNRGPWRPREFVPRGERHDEIGRAAGWYLRNGGKVAGGDLDTIERELLDYAASAFEPDPGGELPWDEFRRYIAYIAAREGVS